VRHFLEIVRAIFLKSAGLTDIVAPLAILSAMAVTVFAAAVWRFRRTLR
jgi:ABC-2 type transport system permease protein